MQEKRAAAAAAVVAATILLMLEEARALAHVEGFLDLLTIYYGVRLTPFPAVYVRIRARAARVYQA